MSQVDSKKERSVILFRFENIEKGGYYKAQTSRPHKV